MNKLYNLICYVRAVIITCLLIYFTAGDQVVKRDHLRIVERNEWLAQPIVAPLDPLVLPAPWVIITHTASESCYSQVSFIKYILAISPI